MLLCCAASKIEVTRPPRRTAGYAGFRAVADERNGSSTALMQGLKHYKVLHEHDNLTGSPFSQLPTALTTVRASRIFICAAKP
jgi:hypothetical protein